MVANLSKSQHADCKEKQSVRLFGNDSLQRSSNDGEETKERKSLGQDSSEREEVTMTHNQTSGMSIRLTPLRPKSSAFRQTSRMISNISELK